ncbi:MAG: 50S ribosomal protein L13 [Chloroflexi bacterium]|nr:50S ribosomal protein L13 [Chloroflexota bacterium]
MADKRPRTYSARPQEVVPAWHVLDAAGRPLGRLAVEVARLLQGKHKPIYTPHILTGDFVVVVNAAQVATTGKKASQKRYYRYSGYPGGLREVSMEVMLAKHPDRLVRLAVRGMLPKGSLAGQMLRRLKVYAGPEHPHKAQLATPRQKAEKVQALAEPGRAEG